MAKKKKVAKKKQADIRIPVTGEPDEKRVSPAYSVIAGIDDYVTAVQGDPYAHRMRVALFWSAASLFYILGDLEIKGLVFLSVENNITHGAFCVFLFIITAFYAVMFFFVFYKVWAMNRPVYLFRILRYLRDEDTEMNELKADFRLWKDFSKRRASPLQKLAPKMPGLKSEEEVFFFMVHRIRVGMLENLFARMFFPVLLCVVALCVLVWELWNLR
ncbi:MAG: hypothetical protein MPL62_16320 [Alphaproteobacteria bacterium]|nr:hypothetical protein [Alphaproteobacteria bacterium]